MDFRSEHYYRAALERMEQATALYSSEAGDRFALAMYTAGLAVECLFRAFAKEETAFDAKHYLPRLFKNCRLLELFRAAQRAKRTLEDVADSREREFTAAVNEVYLLWENTYRFASESRLRAHLKKVRPDAKVKGDILKANALRLMVAARKVIETGVMLWSVHARGKGRS